MHQHQQRTFEARFKAVTMPVSMSGTPAAPRRPASAFGGTANRFSTPTTGSGSIGAYDTTHGTMGAAVNKKSFNKSGGASSFGGGASRESVGLWGIKTATPRDAAQPRSDETAPVMSSFAAKKVASKGPSAAFGGSKDRFAPSTKNSAPASEYVPAGMGSVKKTTAKSSIMGGGKDRFAPVKKAEGGDYVGAAVSDFSLKATTKSFNKSVQKGNGFGGSAPRVSAVEEQAARAAREGGADVAYDVLSKTGAFAAVTAPSNKKPSAAFASKSKKSTEVKVDSDGTAPGMYDAYSSTSMMGQASKSFNRSISAGKGGFGTSASRDTSALIAAAAAEYTPGPGAYSSASDASFGASASASASSAGSAAFASSTAAGERNATIDVTEAPSGPSYDAHSATGMAALASKTHNRSGSGTMGRSDRMSAVAEAAPGDYTLPSAFGASKSASTLANAGFGGVAARGDLFTKEAAPGDYYVGAGAFELKPNERDKPSAVFQSQSGRLAEKASREVGDPGAYNPYDSTTLAATTSKSFNASAQRGAGGFGTSAKRSELSVPNDAPGPGAYESSEGLFERDSHLPSAAFASASEARPTEKLGSAPDVDYDATTADGLGLAASAARTFNRSSMSGAGGFGAHAGRELHAKPSDAPGPGEYSQALADPLSEANLSKTRGKGTGSFASADLRDADDWLFRR